MFMFVPYIFEFTYIIFFFGVVSLVASWGNLHSAHLLMGIPFTVVGVINFAVAVIMGVAYPYSSCALETMQQGVRNITFGFCMVALIIYFVRFILVIRQLDGNFKDSKKSH